MNSLKEAKNGDRPANAFGRMTREAAEQFRSIPWGARLLVIVGVIGLLLVAFGAEFDWPAFAFLVLAISPWLAALIEKLKLGDFEVTLRAKQERQQREIDAAVRFLIMQHATDWEWRHLESLAGDGPFYAELRDSFLDELRHMLATGLITRHPERGFRTLARSPAPKDVKEHFAITDAGRRFLEMRHAIEAEERREVRVEAPVPLHRS